MPRSGSERGWSRARPAPGEDLLVTLHREHGAALTGYALRLTGDPHTAEDLVQEALVRAWRNADRLTEDQGSVRGWLFTVVRNLAHDRARHRARHPEDLGAEPDAPAAPQGPDHAQGVVDAVVVRQALARLTAEHREVLSLLQVEGLSVGEAAARLGVPPGTVKSRTYYALRALKLAYAEIGGTR